MPEPVLAYWYDGGRPSGCWGLFMASDVDDADGVWAPLACEEAAVAVLAAIEAAPPLVTGVRLGGVDDRFCALAEACEATDWLLDLRVEPTSLRKRWFIDDMETSSASAPDGSGGAGSYYATWQERAGRGRVGGSVSGMAYESGRSARTSAHARRVQLSRTSWPWLTLPTRLTMTSINSTAAH